MNCKLLADNYKLKYRLRKEI